MLPTIIVFTGWTNDCFNEFKMDKRSQERSNELSGKNLKKQKLIRITTVPVSLRTLLRGQHNYMRQYFEIVGVSSAGPELTEVAESEGIRVQALEMTRTISPFKDLKSLWLLCQFIRKERPRIVHTHTPKAGTLGMLAAWLCGVPVRLHTVAGLPLMEATGLKRMLLDLVEKITYACATKVYPNSFGLKDIILQNNYCSASKIKVIGNGSSNGIDTAYFSPEQITTEAIGKLKEEYKIAAADFVFVFVGRLVADKGINELVKAFNAISQTYPYTKLLLVGPRESDLDPLNAETDQLLKSNPAILLAGFQTDVRPFLAIANALAFPSYREGFPNVVMQAGAMGLPSIVSDINGCNEIIIEGVNGIIIPPKDEEALYKSMKYFIENPDKVAEMAENARPMIASRYEQKMVWEAILMEYQSL